MNAGALPIELEPDALEMDGRACQWCGCRIDQHRMVDTGEGPEFFCDELETQIYLEAADLVRQWEMGDLRDRWRHRGEAAPPSSNVPDVVRRPYRTAESTVAAFWHVVSLNDLKYLKAWLADHPADAPTLLELLEINDALP